MAKAAAIFVIALVLVAGVLLRPGPRGVQGPAAIPARAIALHAVAPPGVVLRSESSPNRFRVGSERIRSRFRVSSEYEYESTQVGGTGTFIEVRTSILAVEPLVARPLLATADAAPRVSSAVREPRGTGHLTRAFNTAGRHTSSAFRTAGRALRSVF